jgi:hypothetical protein
MKSLGRPDLCVEDSVGFREYFEVEQSSSWQSESNVVGSLGDSTGNSFKSLPGFGTDLPSVGVTVSLVAIDID